jgi:formylglycine-generating enzyme required for sulfatase activity
MVHALVVVAGCSGSSPASRTLVDAGGDGGGGAAAPSCKGSGAGVSACGAAGESCCTTLAVPPGTFFRSDDPISTNSLGKSFPATIAGVSVDKYEVTVGRFRAFVAAEVAGYRPTAGSGKHGTGLNGGKESGWDAAWNANLASSTAEWSRDLACDPAGSTKYATWSAAAGDAEDHPINCVDWYEAYAFCIWDGGFLPTEAEWNYTASGGDDQRVYPWSSPASSITLDCAHANYETSCAAKGTSKVGAESPAGDGKWGHADLGGNVFEWNLDYYAMTYPTPCDDCAELTSGEYRVIRGGSFDGMSVCLLNSLRETSLPADRSTGIGFRCARP